MFDIIFKNVVLQISDYSFTIFALAVLLTSLVILSIGIIVLFREKASRESVLFFLIILAVFFGCFPVLLCMSLPMRKGHSGGTGLLI